MTLTLRYMTLSDVPQVVTIDRLSFNPPWSVSSYQYEITESNYSHMVVLENAQPPTKPTTGFRRLVQTLSRQGQNIRRQVVGYGGLWHIVDEAHISTIATHPAQRGHGYGEIVLAGMIRRAIALNAGYVVLEVRVSNAIAQRLYNKYGFQTVDVKRHYYQSNGEDAYDMRLLLDTPEAQARIHQRFAELHAQYQFVDHYTATRAPRGQS